METGDGPIQRWTKKKVAKKESGATSKRHSHLQSDDDLRSVQAPAAPRTQRPVSITTVSIHSMRSRLGRVGCALFSEP